MALPLKKNFFAASLTISEVSAVVRFFFSSTPLEDSPMFFTNRSTWVIITLVDSQNQRIREKIIIIIIRQIIKREKRNIDISSVQPPWRILLVVHIQVNLGYNNIGRQLEPEKKRKDNNNNKIDNKAREEKDRYLFSSTPSEDSPLLFTNRSTQVIITLVDSQNQRIREKIIIIRQIIKQEKRKIDIYLVQPPRRILPCSLQTGQPGL